DCPSRVANNGPPRLAPVFALRPATLQPLDPLAISEAFQYPAGLQRPARETSVMPIPRASKALSRFTVLDLTRVRSGPTCVRQLADWGANVIKIEMPPQIESGEGLGGPRDGSDFQNLHRNKRSMTLNLKSPEGVAVLKKMVKKADVVVENFLPDVKRRLGIDYKDLRKINPRIVYGSISGFGQDGPYENRPGFDQIAQGMGGLMSITGLPGQGPVRVGIPIADLAAAGADLHARLPGLTLSRERRGRQAGRQQPPDQHPDRRIQDHGRPHQHRGRGRQDLGAHLPGAGGAGDRQAARIRKRRAALEEPRRPQCRDRGDHRQALEHRMDRPLQQG